jgi:hypothetical protein
MKFLGLAVDVSIQYAHREKVKEKEMRAKLAFEFSS